MSDFLNSIQKRRQELQGSASEHDVMNKVQNRRKQLSGEIVARVGDGEIYKMQDGSLSYSSPGYATNDQEIIGRLMEGTTVADEVQRGFDEQIISEHPIAARVQEFNQGAPLIGEHLDQAVGLVSPKAADAMRMTSDAMERRHPVQSAGLNMLGGVVTAAPIIGAGGGNSKVLDWVSKAPGKVAQVFRGAAVAAPVAALEGAASFAGRADGGDRAKEGLTGALVGGGLGAVLGAFAPLVGDAATALSKRWKKLDVSTISSELGISPDAARSIRGYLENDDLQAVESALRRKGNNALLAEAGPGTRQALDDAMSAGGGGLRVGRDAVAGRVAGASSRFKATIDTVLGKPSGVKTGARAISTRNAPRTKAAYKTAYNTPISYATGDIGDDVLSTLQGVPPRFLKGALEAVDDMAREAKLRGEPVPKQIMATIADDGSVSFQQMPDVMQLDFIKRGIDAVAEKNRDSVTGLLTPEGRSASFFAKAVRDVTKKATGGDEGTYARALQFGGDAIQERNALVMGSKLFNGAVKKEDVADMMGDAGPAVLDAARQGIRENIDTIMGRARQTIGDLEAGNVDFDTGANDVAQAVNAVRNLLTEDNISKLRLILPAADVKKLTREISNVSDVMVLRAAVARGSATAIRTAGREAIEAQVQPGLLRQTAGNAGNPLQAMQGVTRTLAAIDPASMNDAQRQVLTEIAEVLTQVKGPAARRALRVVRGAMDGQPIKDAEAKLIGRVFATSSAIGVGQAAKPTLAPPRP